MIHRTQALTEELFDNIAAFGSISQALKQPGMPGRDVVARWCRQDPGFAAELLAVRRIACDVLVDEMLEIADTPPGTREDGTTDSGDVAWATLRVNTRKWTAERVAAAVYGQTNKVAHTDAEGKSLTVYTGLPPRPDDYSDLV